MIFELIILRIWEFSEIILHHKTGMIFFEIHVYDIYICIYIHMLIYAILFIFLRFLLRPLYMQYMCIYVHMRTYDFVWDLFIWYIYLHIYICIYVWYLSKPRYKMYVCIQIHVCVYLTLVQTHVHDIYMYIYTYVYIYCFIYYLHILFYILFTYISGLLPIKKPTYQNWPIYVINLWYMYENMCICVYMYVSVFFSYGSVLVSKRNMADASMECGVVCCSVMQCVAVWCSVS